MDLGHWTSLVSLQDGEQPYGFIYVITNLANSKKYIGKKQCITVYKRPPLKGKKNKRHEIKQTDWKEYTSSCNELNEDIKSLGKQQFKFEIVRWCNSKAELAYYEAKMQFEVDALLNEDYYNGIVNLRISRFKPGKKAINIINEHS